MCTATIIPLQGADGFRLVMNRDELRTRSPALRPAAIELESGIRAVWPTDADAGGTWIAANDRGLALGLLNGNPEPAPSLPPRETLISRGLIIPSLVSCEEAREVIRGVQMLDVHRYAPFRLIAADRSVIADAVWDGLRLRVSQCAMRPVCFVSSGLGDRVVAPRLGLFRRWLARHGATVPAQDAYHEHQWPDRPEISVKMSRRDARTISVTSVEVSHADRTQPADIRMRYRDDLGECEVRLDKAGAARERSRRRAEPARAVGGCAPW